MQSLATTTRGVLRTALTTGAVVLTVAGASLATTAPAEAFVRHGGGFHGSGFHGGGFHRFGGFAGARFGGNRFGYGRGRAFGGYGFRRRVVGFRTFGVRRFAYGVGVPFYGFRGCGIGRHFVPGLGCRLNAVYGYRTFGYGFHRFGYGRPFGGYGHGFRHAGFGGFGHGGFHRVGFGHGGGFRHGGHVHRR